MTTPFERSAADEPLRATWRELSDAVPAPGAHLTEDDWVRFAADELDAPARTRAADHIDACADCAEVFRALSQLREGAVAIDPGAPAFAPSPDELIDSGGPAVTSPPPVPAHGTPAGARSWWYGLAAAAVVVVAVGGVMWRVARVEAPPRVTESAPVRPVEPTVAPAPVPSPRAWADLATAPAVMLPASFTIVMRGETDAGRDAFLTAFGPAIAPYRAGRYAEAAEALQSLTARFPAVHEGWFYLGVARLYAGHAADAVEPLRRARQSDVVAEQALWLEAVALERSGRTDEATSALRAACEADRLSHADACATLPASPR